MGCWHITKKRGVAAPPRCIDNSNYIRRARMRANKPMRCGVVVGTTSVIGTPNVYGWVMVTIGVIVAGIGFAGTGSSTVPPATTTGVPVTLGLALEVFIGIGIGELEGIGMGTTVAGVTGVYAALVVIIGLVLRARMRPKSPILWGAGVVTVFITTGVGTVLPTMGAEVTPVGTGAGATGGSAEVVAANRQPRAATNINRFMLLPPETL